MTQEEKAKAYDEALAKCKAYIEDTTKRWSEEFCKATETVFEDIFPELAESEDERIRKELIELVRELSEEPGRGGLTVRKTEMYISYLEKQKEQKDFHKLYEDIAQSEWFKKAYVGKSLGEEQPTEISKEPHYTKRNELFDKCVKNCDPDIMKKVSDEVDEMLEKEPKPSEWSEADEVYLEDALWCVDKAEKSCKDDEDKGACWAAKRWLKSLRPVSKDSLQSWKPSEAHLSALLAVFNDPNNIGSQTCQLALTDLYEQLNKL